MNPECPILRDPVQALMQHQARLKACHKCPDMQGPPVTGQAAASPVLLLGQAPGDKEPKLQRPFAWTAGKTLFKWFEGIGLDEQQVRARVYMAAVCRCFPGKKPRGGDRVPSLQEVANCRVWLQDECELIRPRLLIPVGKLAIAQFLPVNRLAEVIGQVHEVDCFGDTVDCVPLPHPSGASTWHRTSPGRELLQDALRHIEDHSAWQTLLGD
jgi:uracil-DNA glycosylase